MVETENLPYSKNNLKSNWKGALGIKCPWHVRSFNGMCQKGIQDYKQKSESVLLITELFLYPLQSSVFQKEAETGTQSPNKNNVNMLDVHGFKSLDFMCILFCLLNKSYFPHSDILLFHQTVSFLITSHHSTLRKVKIFLLLYDYN